MKIHSFFRVAAAVVLSTLAATAQVTADEKHSLAVLPFANGGGKFEIRKRVISAATSTTRFVEALNNALLKSRKFTMLERRADDAIAAELAQPNQPNASLNDVAHFTQLLGTDYMVFGSLRFCDIPAATANATQTDAIFAEITYRVVLAPNGETKRSNSLALPLSLALAIPENSAQGFESALLGAMAKTVAEDIVDAIYPVRVIAKQDASVIIGNNGALEVGDYLRVYALGQQITDTYTDEVLGTSETPIATIQVIENREKMLYARVVSGNLSEIEREQIVRRCEAPSAAQQQAIPAPELEFELNPGAGTVTPPRNK